MQVHFIAIGGSAMHNLAIALKRKGIIVTGSDDEIFEPSKSRLEKEGLLPKTFDWDIKNIHSQLDAIILGMHAREDNPELTEAKRLGLKIYSYPEYLYEQSKDKIRIVIGGSHGKTTITSMILHVCKELNLSPDYMVGAQLEGYDCMVKLSHEAQYMILEGDEYLSSPIDRRPKFHLYHAHIGLISGIAWDHINVFPTFENYVEQFKIFIEKIEKNGLLIYNKEDNEVDKICSNFKDKLRLLPYSTPNYKIIDGQSIITYQDKEYPLNIFGQHNLQNLMAALFVCKEMGIDDEDFFKTIKKFKGAGKRLEKIFENNNLTVFKDFAHSPSKLKATVSAVKENFPKKKLVACMELHTFSSLNENFLPLYKDSMNSADSSMVYFNLEVLLHKKLPLLTDEKVKMYFGDKVQVCHNKEDLFQFIKNEYEENTIILLMSSGNFDNIEYEKIFNVFTK
ncbi:MAG: peptidoglycan synthetase [Flavobacteriia bacterium]|nr:peptidoglycan synthetase [Flavobacteriia bacterium]